jgi:hypothetical protein
MKRVFLACVLLILIAEIVLWSANVRFWGLIAGVQIFFLAFNLMEALLPRLSAKNRLRVTKARQWGLLHQPVSWRGDWRFARRLGG